MGRNDQMQCQQRYRKAPPRNRQYSAGPYSTTLQPIEGGDYGGWGEVDDDGGEDDLYDGVGGGVGSGAGGEQPDQPFPYDTNAGRGYVDIASNAISQCPVENGVLRTTWGAVAAGPLIAGNNNLVSKAFDHQMIYFIYAWNLIGIAAGLVQQNVATQELIKLTRHYVAPNRRQQFQQNGYKNNRWTNRQPIQLNVDNRWAATLAGDLAEVTLLQAPIAAREISVGAAGAWNSTTVPHWYFLSQRERLEMTDAEIRGGIDGLAIGLNIAEWRRDISQLRLSQLLDMYYSNRGFLTSKFRSCNRRELFTEYAQPNQLQAQSMAFSTVLDREMQLQYTLSNKNIEQFSTASAESLVNYMCM